MSTVTDLAADTRRAQAALDALIAEQRDLPGLISHASRGDNPDTWARLALRQANIAHEIREASTDLLYARLAHAWADVDNALEPATRARAALHAAHHAVEDYDAGHRAPATTLAELATRQLERAHLLDTLRDARISRDNATFRAESALQLVDQLEDEIEVATGERPTPGDNICANPTPLDATYVMQPPGADLQPLRVFQAGTRPPRWVAYRLANAGTP